MTDKEKHDFAIALIRKGATRRAVERETGLSVQVVRKLFLEIEKEMA
jgi:DNA invertase Pin-like site-specific DNA recombinase